MVIDYATHSDLDFGSVKMATSILKVALMVFFVLIICAILLVPIALMVTLEDKEEQKSTVPVKKNTEAAMAKTAETTTSPTTTTPTTTLAHFGGLILGGGGAGLPPLLGGGGAGLPPMPEVSDDTNDNSGLQCSDAFVNQLLKSSPPFYVDDTVGACNPSYIGDGYCDGSCNTPDNNFDQGDCCSTTINYQYCNYDDCECYCFTEGKQYEASGMPNNLIGGGGGLPPGGGGGGLPPPPPTTVATSNSGPLSCSNTFAQKVLPPFGGTFGDQISPSSSSCNEAFIGDGYCDGDCNTPAHNYDEGDCCLTTINYNYCSYDDCTCYCYPEDKQYEAVIDMPPPLVGGGGGLLPPLLGGGGAGLPPTLAPPSENMCIPEPSCSISAKLMPLIDLITTISPVVDPLPTPVVALCNLAFVGDGFCDGSCNILNPDNNDATTEDDWDGGDCCVPPTDNFNFCNIDCCECFCYEKGIQYEKEEEDYMIITGPPAAPEQQSCPENYKGDGFCDAECNNEASGYDDGDCCLDVIMDQYCSNGPPPGCMCHEDGTVHEVEQQEMFPVG